MWARCLEGGRTPTLVLGDIRVVQKAVDVPLAVLNALAGVLSRC